MIIIPKKVVSFLILVFVLFLIYNFASQLETPLWMMQFTFYAFMTAIFGFIFLGILAPLTRDYLKKREMKRIEEKEALESRRKEYEHCVGNIESNIKNYLEKNKWDIGVVAYLEVIVREVKSNELKGQIQELIEKYRLYLALLTGSECITKSFIEAKVRKSFPETLKIPFALDEFLQVDYLMTRYFNGEKVTDSWFRETHPTAYKNIIKSLHESEREDLDNLFRELNNYFETNNVLRRFRKEKEGLIKHGQETIKALKREIDSLNEQLKKYSNLRKVEEARPIM